MALIETQAIILRTYTLAEADKIAVCLTREMGLIRGVGRGARRLKSKFGASLEPFTLINLTFFQKEERELVTIRHAEITRSFFNLSPTAETIFALEYLAQLAIDFAPPYQTEERLYRMVKATISAAFDEQELIAQITIYFELWILRLAGFLPDIGACGKCLSKLHHLREGVYINFEGVLFCAQCKNPELKRLNFNIYTVLLGMRKLDAISWGQACARLTAQEQKALSQITRRLIVRALEKSTHVNTRPPIKRTSLVS